MLSTWKTAPALAAGCTVVLKPAEWSPLSCSLLADLVAEAGFPPGVFNVVQGIGEEVGAALDAPSRRAADLVHRLARDGACTSAPPRPRNIVPFTGELGGKGPLLVFADADLEAAARKAAGQYDDAGQVCLAGHAPARRGVASPTRSSSSSTASPTSTSSATRATTRRPSRR